MSDIYLNFSHADMEIARQVYDILTAANFHVWVDAEYNPGSAEWKQASRAALKNSGCMVVLLSPSAARSEWVEEMVGYARLSHITIFPILIAGELRRATPLGLKVDSYTDFRERKPEELKKLMDHVNHFLEAFRRAHEQHNDEDDRGWREEDWDDDDDDDDDPVFFDDYERDEY
jgi:hypothetical protein